MLPSSVFSKAGASLLKWLHHGMRKSDNPGFLQKTISSQIDRMHQMLLASESKQQRDVLLREIHRDLIRPMLVRKIQGFPLTGLDARLLADRIARIKPKVVAIETELQKNRIALAEMDSKNPPPYRGLIMTLPMFFVSINTEHQPSPMPQNKTKSSSISMKPVR